MNNFKLYRIYLLVFIFSGLALASCDKNDGADENQNEYLITNEYKTSVTAQDIKSKLFLAQLFYPEVASFGGEVKTDISIQKITYKTTLQNKNIKASGLVYLPKSAGEYPVLCFQNGTNTLHVDAPSENLDSDMLFMLESVASMGFIVVIPDYIGFGESSQLVHPYLHAESTTQSILDMLRATKEFSKKDTEIAKPTKDLYIFGYSQGGWATMLLQSSIEKNYSDEFNLIASSCAAGPYSIEYMNNYIVAQPNYIPYFLAYMLNAYTSLNLIPNPLGDFFQAPYALKIPGLFDGKHNSGDINSALTTKMADLLTPEYLNKIQFDTNPKFSAFKSILVANSVKPWKIATPTRLYHGDKDEVIPLGMSQKIIQDLKTAGTTESTIELKIIAGANHSEGVIPVGISTIKWFIELTK